MSDSDALDRFEMTQSITPNASATDASAAMRPNAWRNWTAVTRRTPCDAL
jgi:hypothetical protein